MMDGISICVPSHNRLKYLPTFVVSARKYSSLPKTELCILDDASDDGTVEWLTKRAIPFKSRPINVGAYSGWNNAVKIAKNEYVFLADTHHVFSANWDEKIARWIEELRGSTWRYVIMPQVIEGIRGSYQPPHGISPLDCGTPEDFDWESFLKASAQYADRHEAIADPCGWWCISKDLFWSVGGFDERYDPMTCGTIDLQMALCRAHPNLRFIRVWDSTIYHFYHDPKERESWETPEYQAMHRRNVSRFESKWQMTIEKGYRSIRVGLGPEG